MFFVVVCQSRDLYGGPRRSASSGAAFSRANVRDIPACVLRLGPQLVCRTTALHLDTQRESTDQQSAGRFFYPHNLKREELTDSSTGLFVPFEPFSPLSISWAAIQEEIRADSTPLVHCAAQIWVSAFWLVCSLALFPPSLSAHPARYSHEEHIEAVTGLTFYSHFSLGK